MTKRNMINVTPMVPGYEKEIAADLIDMHRRGIIQSAMFSFTLVPEGDPVSDKASRLAELYKKHVKALGKSKLPVGILFQATMGHGWTPAVPTPWTKFKCSNGLEKYVFCPLGKEFQSYIRSQARTLAALRPDFFMIDDDTRMHTGRGGCFCDLHVKGFNALTRKKYTRETLCQALCKDDDLAEKWDMFQQEGLFRLMKIIREEFDKVDPKIPGMFCSCCSDIRHAPAMARILAGKGNRCTVRINNGPYLYMVAKPGESALWMQRTAAQFAHLDQNTQILVETDTCTHCRYATSAQIIHAVYTWSLLNGADGGKLWITNTVDYDPESGAAYRKKLEKYSKFYDAVHVMKPEWQGVVIPLKPYPKFNAANGNIDFSSFTYPSWGSSAMAFFGIPYAYAEKPLKDCITALTKTEVSRYTDQELRSIFAHRVLLDGSAALELARRNLSSLAGCSACEWDLKQIVFEKSADGTMLHRAQNSVHLRDLAPGAEIRTMLYHAPFKNAKESEKLSPGCVFFRNSLGGEVLTVSFIPGGYGWSNTGVFNLRRKEFLLRDLGIKVYSPCDAPRSVHAFLDRGIRTYCIFNLGMDLLEELPFAGIPKDAEAEMLQPDGTWKVVKYRKGAFQLQLLPMDLVFLRLR